MHGDAFYDRTSNWSPEMVHIIPVGLRSEKFLS